MKKNTWFQPSHITAVGVFGVVGACFRYMFSFLNQPHGSSFPWGTLCVNLIGCFILAWIYHRWEYSHKLPKWFQVGFSTGFIGSFTTFSTFSVDWVKMVEHQQWLSAIIYSSISIVGGFVSVIMGYELSRRKGEGTIQ